jgi:hypothetical protein
MIEYDTDCNLSDAKAPSPGAITSQQKSKAGQASHHNVAVRVGLWLEEWFAQIDRLRGHEASHHQPGRKNGLSHH